MGTHPIFESDFDCLTDRIGMSKTKNPPIKLETNLEYTTMKTFDRNGQLYDCDGNKVFYVTALSSSSEDISSYGIYNGAANNFACRSKVMKPIDQVSFEAIMETIELGKKATEINIICDSTFPKHLMLDYFLGDGKQGEQLGYALAFERLIDQTMVRITVVPRHLEDKDRGLFFARTLAEIGKGLSISE